MLMWSALYVAQPSASSDRSPVPTTRPPTWFATSISICVRSRAWAFSYVTEWSFSSWSMSAKCWRTAFVMLTSRSVAPRASARTSELPCVRSVVPKPGMVTATMPEWSMPRMSKARAVTSRASVESSPPDTPMTAALERVCAMRFARPYDWIESTSSQRALRCAASDGTNGCGSTQRVSSVGSASSEKGVTT